MNKSQKQKLLEEQIAEDARMIALLEEHRSKWPETKRRYDALDKKCIEIAAKYNAQMAAGSPEAIVTALELRKLRWERDAVKSEFSRRIDSLRNPHLGIVEPVILAFGQFALELSQKTLTLGRAVTEKVIPYADGAKKYVVRHNAGKLAQLRGQIQEAVRTVREMRERPLGEIMERIEKFKQEFNDFDSEEMEVEEVDEIKYSDLNQKTEPTKSDTGLLSAKNFINLNQSPRERLETKFAQLKDDPIFRRP